MTVIAITMISTTITATAPLITAEALSEELWSVAMEGFFTIIYVVNSYYWRW